MVVEVVVQHWSVTRSLGAQDPVGRLELSYIPTWVHSDGCLIPLRAPLSVQPGPSRPRLPPLPTAPPAPPPGASQLSGARSVRDGRRQQQEERHLRLAHGLTLPPGQVTMRRHVGLMDTRKQTASYRNVSH